MNDVLATEPCDPETLVRYAQDPDALSASERAAVEAALAESPAQRDALAAWQQLRGRFTAESAPEAAPTPAVAPARRAPARRRRALTRYAASAAALAAAVLLAIFVFGPSGPGPEDTPRIAQRPDVPAPPPAPEPVPQPRVEDPTPPAPPAPEPREIVEEPLAPIEPLPIEPLPVEPAPQSPPRSAPIMLAMATPTYNAPSGAGRRRPASVLRGGIDVPELQAISPEHVARSATARPTLFWRLSKLPAQSGEFWFSVSSDADFETLVERRVEPGAAGLQRIELAAELAPGVDYTWSVLFRPDPDDPAHDVVSLGWLRFEPPADAQRRRIDAADAGARPAVLAELGYFYDAHAQLRAAAARQPDNATVRAALGALLQQAGVAP